MKVYKLTKGECKDCTLSFECQKNKDNIKHFLISHRVLCENGKCVEVVDSDKNKSD